jgi:hypothetical protein
MFVVCSFFHDYIGSEVLTAVARHQLHAGLLLGLFFNFEDGGDMFLRNIS